MLFRSLVRTLDGTAEVYSIHDSIADYIDGLYQIKAQFGLELQPSAVIVELVLPAMYVNCN